MGRRQNDLSGHEPTSKVFSARLDEPSLEVVEECGQHLINVLLLQQLFLRLVLKVTQT